jgi:hypothetical protein
MDVVMGILGDWFVVDGMLSVAENNESVGVGGTNEMRGEGDRERRRPEREGSADSRLGDGARDESSVNDKSVVDSESLGRLRDEEDEQGGGARKSRLLGCKLAESPEQIEGVELVMQVCGEAVREDRDPAGLGTGDVVGVRFGDGSGSGNNSFSFSFSSSSSSGMRGVRGVLQLGEGEVRVLAVDELDAAVRRRINGTLHSSLSNHSVSWLVVDGPVSLERRRLSISSTLIEIPRVP